MVVKCEDVWREISNYLDGDLDPDLKRALEQHFSECRDCTAVRDGIQNVVALYGDKQMFALPADFDLRLRRLKDQIQGQKGSSLGWLVGMAAAGALAALALFSAAQSRSVPQLRAPMTQPARQRPQQLVAIVAGGKTFHRVGCPYMH